MTDSNQFSDTVILNVTAVSRASQEDNEAKQRIVVVVWSELGVGAGTDVQGVLVRR